MRYRPSYAVAGLLALLLVMLASLAITHQDVPQAPDSWTLWQLPGVTHKQMMSYIMRTSAGHLIVIDGGWAEDAPALAAFIRDHGGAVQAWFITHPHPDHVGALTALLASSSCPPIQAIYASLPTEDFVREHEPTHLLDLVQFRAAAATAALEIHDLPLGDSFMIDALRVEVLGVRNPEIFADPINNSSLVFRISGQKSVLFLGDLGPEGGDKILRGPFAHSLYADYVQMAHHGQLGVDKNFYDAVAPACCLWPTPRWIWDNDLGDGPDTGPLKTLDTRRWMKELGVKTNIVAMDGLAQIDE